MLTLRYLLLIFILGCSMIFSTMPSEAAISEIRTNILGGTLNMPTNWTGDIVLIIPGSGPTDRNGNSPYGTLHTNMYELLADGMALEGIASVRVDKRGMFGSAATGVNPNAVTLELYVHDVQLWITEILKISGVKRIWLLGHSEGAQVVLKTATVDTRLSGIILAACPAMDMGSLLRGQLAKNPANAGILPDVDLVLAKLKAGKTVELDKIHPALQPFFYLEIQPFLISMMRFDPLEASTKLSLPVLILQGTEDIQVMASDAKLLSAAATQSTLVFLKGATHTLKCVPEDAADSLVTYTNPAIPLSPETIPAVVSFIDKGRNGSLSKKE